jgi:hypothetical protein
MNKARLAQLEAMLNAQPDDPFLHYAWGMEHYTQKPEVALRKLREVRKKFPTYLPSFYPLAQLLVQEELLPEANSCFVEGLRLAAQQGDKKAAQELQSAYDDFLCEYEDEL